MSHCELEFGDDISVLYLVTPKTIDWDSFTEVDGVRTGRTSESSTIGVVGKDT